MLFNLIKKYQEAADRAVNIFKLKYQVTDIIEGWNNDVYPSEVVLPEERITGYIFLGFGLEVYFKGGEGLGFGFLYTPRPVDLNTPVNFSKRGFCFARYYPPRHDGINLFALINIFFLRRPLNEEYQT